jgi:hypothetical protein
MAPNRSQAKHAKALRRKKQMAERSRQLSSGASSSPAERARRAAAAPLHCCLVQDGLFEFGSGMAVVARQTGFGIVTVAVFLLDAFCLGIKDVFLREMETADLDAFLAQMGVASPFSPVEPAYARKLLRDLVHYADSLGFEPPGEFRAAELLFGDARAEDCATSFAFGDDGMPHYIPGPSDTPSQIRRRLKRLSAQLGADGFLFSEAPDDDADLDFDDQDVEAVDDVDDSDAYDPAVAPDAADWLALDEQERLYLVESYHRRAGISLPAPAGHAAWHVAVENQIAADDPPATQRTLARLTAEGLDRHETIHAIAWVLTDRIQQSLAESADFSNAVYEAALDELTESAWRAACQDDEDDRE